MELKDQTVFHFGLNREAGLRQLRFWRILLALSFVVFLLAFLYLAGPLRDQIMLPPQALLASSALFGIAFAFCVMILVGKPWWRLPAGKTAEAELAHGHAVIRYVGTEPDFQVDYDRVTRVEVVYGSQYLDYDALKVNVATQDGKVALSGYGKSRGEEVEAFAGLLRKKAAGAGVKGVGSYAEDKAARLAQKTGALRWMNWLAVLTVIVCAAAALRLWNFLSVPIGMVAVLAFANLLVEASGRTFAVIRGRCVLIRRDRLEEETLPDRAALLDSIENA